MAGLMQHRDARIYVLAQCLSVAGDSALWLGMGIWVKILTGSNTEAGLVFFAYIAGALTAPIGGMVADRFRRRPLLIWANFASAAAVCALLVATHRGDVWIIYAVMFVYGAVGSLVISAQTALLAVMLPDELLGDANATLQTAEQGLRVLTPIAGAGLIAWVGPKPVVLIDAVTFVIAGIAVASLKIRESAVSMAGHWMDEFTAGMRHIRQTEALRKLLLAGVIALIAFGLIQPTLYAIVANGLHRSPPFLGVLQVAMGVGGIVGGLLSMAIQDKIGERVLVLAGILAAAVAFPILTIGSLVPVLIAMFLIGACFVSVNIGAYTLIQRRTPNELIGRVDAALSMAIMVPQGLALATGSALLAWVNFRPLLVVMTVILLLAAIPMLGVPAPEPRAAQPEAAPAETPAVEPATS
nr:MFS transporter [Catenulispora sp.]